MSLRTRMVLLAGVAVAVAVVAVAVAAYVGTRTELQGQVDQSLQSLTNPPLANVRGGAGGPAPGPNGAPAAGLKAATGAGFFSPSDPDDRDEGLGFDRPPRSRRSAVRPGRSRSFKPRRRQTYVADGAELRDPVDPGDQALAAQRPRPVLHGRCASAGTHIRVLVTGSGRAARWRSRCR